MTQDFEGEFDFTIGKTIKYSFSDGFKDCIEYKYFVNGVIHKGCLINNDSKIVPLNTFFKVKYSKKDPSISIINFKEQIRDSTEIVKAGFKLRSTTH
ncbi:MAG: hypothetical protein EOO44_08705 [Flavobacterium sp.]|nr:MAG: hypothetical protein EOO44_08705 [Flavobacterium sp.]